MSKKTSPKDLEQQLHELTEALQRERADSENMRRRHEEQIGGLKQIVKASVVRDLLPVIDNFERALRHVPEVNEQAAGNREQEGKHLDEWIKGISGIKVQFDKTLADLGVTKIKTVGEVFDPRFHEAVSMEEGDGTTEVVSEELQPGYTLGDEVIRHSMVRVKMEKVA